jgi:iron complex transport system substrate-binding protein
MTRLILLPLALIWSLTVAARPIVSEQGPSKPARIISIVPAVTEMLFAVGAGDRVVAVGNFDKYPPEVNQRQRVGALLDPDVERILSLRPDLVFLYHTQKDLMTQLKRAGIQWFSYAHSGLPDVTVTIRQVGERVGEPRRADELASAIEKGIDAIRARVSGRPRPRTLVIFGRDAFALRGMFASGGKGFIHDMVTAAGGDNVFADAQRESVQATTELLIARRPDVILELRADPIDAATEAKELKVWGALSSVPAVKLGRVHIIADQRTVIPGPRVAEGAELFWRALHEPK